MYQYWAESQAAQHYDYHHHPHPRPRPHCPHLPGTVLRISIPPGAVINLANLLEVVSPSGICLIVRIPCVGGGLKLHSLVEAIQKAGGTVEFQ